MKKGNTYEVLITETQFPGLGVGYYEGEKVLVKGAIPGQNLSVRVTKKRKKKIEGKIVEIINDASYKIPPKCEVFGLCGGCTHQFISLKTQEELKTQQVLKLFQNAGIEGFKFLGIESSPKEWEYRNKMEFSFGDMEKGGELTLGMHVREMNFGIITTDCCKIVDEDFRIILKTVLNYCRENSFTQYKVMKKEGYLRNLVVRKGEATGDIMVNLVTTSQIEHDFTPLADALKNIKYKGNLVSILHTINDGLADVVVADELKVLYGRDYIEEELLGLKFKISPFSFFQTNSKGAEKLYSIVKDFMGDKGKEKVVFDLYCGTGTIGQIAAVGAKKVVGIELIEEAVKAANENAKLNGLNNCNFIAGDIAKVITEVKETPDVIILDPPRPGVHPVALDYVMKFNVKDIIYVSCNPKTLVEDLKVMIEQGYEVKEVKIMDMFPATPHVETVVKIERR